MMTSKSPLFSHEALVYPAIMVIIGIVRTVSASGLGDAAVLLASLVPVVLLGVCLLLMINKYRPSFIICGVYMLLSAILNLVAAVIAVASSDLSIQHLFLLLSAMVLGLGGYRLIRLWQGMGSTPTPSRNID